jgi:hypothetical protein
MDTIVTTQAVCYSLYMSNAKLHPFEMTIGPGPYQYVGFGCIEISERFGARYSGPELERGCGTCAHCGTAILNIFVIRAGDGKNYGVGCDCIEKSNLPYAVKNAVEKQRLLRERDKRRAASDRRRVERNKRKADFLARFLEYWPTSKLFAETKTKPHPVESLAAQGLTLNDYISWNLTRGNDGPLAKYGLDLLRELAKESGK